MQNRDVTSADTLLPLGVLNYLTNRYFLKAVYFQSDATTSPAFSLLACGHETQHYQIAAVRHSQNRNSKRGARTTSGELTSGELGLVGSRQQLGGLASRQRVAGNGGGVVVVADSRAVVDSVLAEREHRVLLVQCNCLVEAVQDGVGSHCAAEARQAQGPFSLALAIWWTAGAVSAQVSMGHVLRAPA